MSAGDGGEVDAEGVEVGDVYIDNKHVGTGLVELTWNDLVGTAERQPLAIPISSDASSPSADGMGAVTAEALAGEGSQIVWSRQGMTAGAQNVEPIWLSKACIGWKTVEPVEIVIDLHAIQAIDAVQVSSGSAPTAGVCVPSVLIAGGGDGDESCIVRRIDNSRATQFSRPLVRADKLKTPGRYVLVRPIFNSLAGRFGISRLLTMCDRPDWPKL